MPLPELRRRRWAFICRPSRWWRSTDGTAAVDGAALGAVHAERDAGLQLAGPRGAGRRPRGRCLADSLIRREPDADDTLAREKLVPTTAALRRLVYQLDDIGLPVEPFWRRDGGLAFDLLSSYSTGEKVTIGHANGVITIDLVESLDDYRESLRVRLGEPYRTMLGHFRHEVGHYYQNVLVETGVRCRRIPRRVPRLFGDERASYSDAIARHYKFGAPVGLAGRPFISEYATMHPWEDFAGVLRALPAHRRHHRHRHARRAWCCTPTGSGSRHRATSCRWSPTTTNPIERMLFDWKWMSLFFNRVNTAMGKNPLYPFEIREPVVDKLGFVHRWSGSPLQPDAPASSE